MAGHGRFGPCTGRFVPCTGRFVPCTGRFVPCTGRFAIIPTGTAVFLPCLERMQQRHMNVENGRAPLAALGRPVTIRPL